MLIWYAMIWDYAHAVQLMASLTFTLLTLLVSVKLPAMWYPHDVARIRSIVRDVVQSHLMPGGCTVQMVLKCADIGHLAADVATHKRWSLKLEEEFFRQVSACCACCAGIPALLMSHITCTADWHLRAVLPCLWSSLSIHLSHVFSAREPVSALT